MADVLCYSGCTFWAIIALLLCHLPCFCMIKLKDCQVQRKPYFVFFQDANAVSEALFGYVLRSMYVFDIDECFRECVKNCKCASFNFKTLKESFGYHRCELNYEEKQTNPRQMKKLLGWRYHNVEIRYTEKAENLNEGNECCSENPCLHNGRCVTVKSHIKRFSCQCKNGFTGRFCHIAKTCSAHAKLKPGITSGNFTLIDNTDQSYTGFCNMDYKNSIAWTLVYSFAFLNRYRINKGPMVNDPINEETPNFVLYRNTLERMLSVRSHSPFWSATCNYDQKRLIYSRDYVIGAFSETNLFDEDTDSKRCATVRELNIRGTTCLKCKANVQRGATKSFHVGVRNSKIRCGFPINSNKYEQAFGHYVNLGGGTGCTRSDQSTTQLWFGEPIN